MKKFIYTSSLLLLISISVNAQLTMNWDKKISIGTDMVGALPLLMAGYDSYFEENYEANIGTGGAPDVGNGNNIGVFVGFWVNSNFSHDSNFGVRGVVEQNINHGRNYGLCGMIDLLDNFSKGAGIYATDCDYCYTFPHNLGGAYAGYFVGNVHVSNNLTAPSLYTIMDSRLCDNIVSLSQSKRNGKTTLENLMNMNIVEYNLKGRLFEEVSVDIAPEKAEELKRELEILKKEEQKMSSRRHYGVDVRELQKVYPDLVLEGKDGSLSVNYLEMIPLVIRSIQELKQEIDELAEVDE